MSYGENAIIVVASRWLTPLSALFAFTLLADWPAGVGIGFAAGAILALPFVLNALIFGVGSVLRSAPPILLRAVLGLALALAFASAGLPNMPWSAILTEFSAFLATASAISLVSVAIMGRAGALRDATW
ncbi:MAG: hypothetical protein HY054_16005 [Proteobacteria bacterium]|nr:hypothetical protein [Pseudomonadota bacterium]